MVDERGRDKNQICNDGRRVENEMWDNYRFILLVRASYFRSASKTVSIPEHLGHLSHPVPRIRERSLHTCAQDVQITRMATI
jgi:hypothetical protein